MQANSLDIPAYLSVLPLFHEMRPVELGRIASLLSLTPEYFSRVLRELEDGGYIAIDRRDIRILDVQGLSRYHLQ